MLLLQNVVKIFVIFLNFKFKKLQILFDFELSYLRITTTLKIFKNIDWVRLKPYNISVRVRWQQLIRCDWK